MKVFLLLLAALLRGAAENFDDRLPKELQRNKHYMAEHKRKMAGTKHPGQRKPGEPHDHNHRPHKAEKPHKPNEREKENARKTRGLLRGFRSLTKPTRHNHAHHHEH